MTHLGLGDAIVSGGLAVAKAMSHGGLRFPCWKHNEPSVKSFFVNYPEIEVVPIDRDDLEGILHQEKNAIFCGHYSGEPALEDEGFDAWIYRTAGESLDLRWELDPVVDAMAAVSQRPSSRPIKYFIHDDPRRDFSITKNRVHQEGVQPWPNNDCEEKCNSILEYAYWLKKAESIHVINSAFLHLAESLPTTGSLYLHAYARPHSRIDMPRLNKKWTVIE